MRVRLLAVVSVAAALVVSGCTASAAGSHYRFTETPEVGQTIAVPARKLSGDFTGSLLDGGAPADGGVAGGGGGTFRLGKDAGAVTVINFWATDCAPCAAETPQFDLIYRAYRAKGVQFVGIDTKEYSRSASAQWVASRDISYPMVWDEQGATALAIGHLPATALPFTVVLDRQRRVAAVYVGELGAKDIEPVLDRLLAEPA